MQEICPICGSKTIRYIDFKAKKCRCLSCDEVFTIKEKPIIKEIVRTVVEKVAGDTFSAKDIYNKNIDSIMEVTANFGDVESNGTGFYISPEGYMITNAHVLIEIKNKKAVLCDSVYVCKSRSTEFLDAEIIYLDAKNDLALLKVSDNTNRKVVSFAKNDVEVGDKIFAIGNSLGSGLNLLDGMVGDVNRQFKSTSAFLFNALVTQGCSGGPVFNDKGEVCGVTVGGTNTAVGMNYALPISVLLTFIDLAKKEKGITF